MVQELIGRSEEGRPLRVVYAGEAAAPLRVLVVAGQHGDEEPARAAVEEFLRTVRAVGCPRVRLAVVPDLNPDGAARNQRSNARGLDLNRDHQRLAAAETQALHRFVRAWHPHLVVDVHTYPPRRRRLLAHHLVHCHDLFLDAATTPSLRRPALDAEAPGFLPPVLAALNARGYRSARYIVTTADGEVRHSTPDVRDARNGLALRYGVPTLLIEGRKPMRGDGSAGRARLRAAVGAALDVVLRWAGENEGLLTAPAPPPADAEWVAIRCRRRRADPCVLPFLDARSGAIREREVPGVYRPRIEVTQRIRLPAAYAVPRAHGPLLAVLRRHGFASLPADPNVCGTVERYRLVSPPRRERQGRPSADTLVEQRTLAGSVLFPVTADGGHALAVYLEPESKYGLHRFAEMGLAAPPGSFYPVWRVLRWNPPAEPGTSGGE